MRSEAVHRRPECPEPDRWAAPDDYATEREVSRFLGDLVRVVKPDLVVETGSYEGFTSAEIGLALADLGRGRLVSLEVDPVRAEIARSRVRDLPVEVITGSSLEYRPDAPVDLLFLDSEFDLRMRELRRFHAWASPRCVVALHDSACPPYPGMAEMLQGMEVAVEHRIVRPWFPLPTPRGLALTRYA